MPVMSKNYCLNTPKSKMGFSQIASCKSQGFIKRTSKTNKGKYLVSKKYKKRKDSKKYRSKNKSINKSLYYNGSKKPRVISGYGTELKAKQTLKNIKPFDKQYQFQVVNTMYNRAKFHANQTKGMKEAMKVYKKWLIKNKYKSN